MILSRIGKTPFNSFLNEGHLTANWQSSDKSAGYNFVYFLFILRNFHKKTRALFRLLFNHTMSTSGHAPVCSLVSQARAAATTFSMKGTEKAALSLVVV